MCRARRPKKKDLHQDFIQAMERQRIFLPLIVFIGRARARARPCGHFFPKMIGRMDGERRHEFPESAVVSGNVRKSNLCTLMLLWHFLLI